MAKKAAKPRAKEIRCPECETAFFYFRVQNEDYRCRKCGALFVWSEKKGKTVLKKDRKEKA